MNYSSTMNIDAWHLVNCTAAASRNVFFLIKDLHFITKWRSSSFQYRRGFDLFANGVKIQQGTPRRCSYFQFVSFRLSKHSYALENSGNMVDSSFTIETKCIVWHQIFERQAQRTVLQTLTLWLSCIQFSAYTPSSATTQANTIKKAV